MGWQNCVSWRIFYYLSALCFSSLSVREVHQPPPFRKRLWDTWFHQLHKRLQRLPWLYILPTPKLVCLTMCSDTRWVGFVKAHCSTKWSISVRSYCFNYRLKVDLVFLVSFFKCLFDAVFEWFFIKLINNCLRFLLCCPSIWTRPLGPSDNCCYLRDFRMEIWGEMDIITIATAFMCCYFLIWEIG